MLNRREFVLVGSTSALLASMQAVVQNNAQSAPGAVNADGRFWPNRARMVISVSIQMEGGA